MFRFHSMLVTGTKMSPGLPKIQDEERESKFGYVFAVSGPGKLIA